MFCNNSPENFTNSGTVRNSGIRYKRKTEGISLIDQIKVLKNCSVIVSAAMVLYALCYLISGNWFLVILLIILGGVLLIPCHFMVRSETVKQLSVFMVVMIDFIIFVAQIFSREFAPGAALYACSLALSALFLSRPLVRLCCICSAVLFIAECVVLSIMNNQLIDTPMVLGECLLAILVAYILLDQAVKNSIFYLTEAHNQEKSSARLLGELDKKQQQNEQVLGNQQQLLKQIAQISAHISKEAKSLADQSDSLASGSTSQAASLSNVSNAVEEIYRQISDTANQAAEVRSASETMRRHAGDGDVQMQELLSSISDIESSVQSIEATINSIQSLAFQTNILALNASVEAARAGTSGKGFAVVAEEVRTLAGHSSEAAENIMQVLNRCREAVSQGSNVASKTSVAMGRIKESVEKVASQSVRISDRTDSQMNAVNSIKEDLGVVSGIVQSNAAASQECSAMVRELSEQALRLDHLSKA